MLASRCLPSFIVAAAKRPHLSAFMSSETNSNPQGLIQDMMKSTAEAPKDSDPPTAPSDSYPPNPMAPKDKSVQHDPETKPTYHLHWKSTRHNTAATFTDDKCRIVSWVTGGSCGFKHSRRGEYEAGYQCAVKMFKKIEQTLLVAEKPFQLELIYKGFGQGRQALDSALQTSEGENIRPILSRLTDGTPLKIGGTRAKKARRI